VGVVNVGNVRRIFSSRAGGATVGSVFDAATRLDRRIGRQLAVCGKTGVKMLALPGREEKLWWASCGYWMSSKLEHQAGAGRFEPVQPGAETARPSSQQPL